MASAQPTPAPSAEDHALGEVVVALHHEQGRAEDRAVHGDQRQEHAERVVERRHVLVEEHLEDLHQRRDHADIGQEAKEAQIDVRQSRPGQGAVGEQVVVDQVVDRAR
jgi:hypothetical protein